MRRFPAALAVGVIAALATNIPAQAFVAASGTDTASAAVVQGRSLTVTGTVAAFDKNAKTTDPPVPVTATLSNPNAFHVWAHTVAATVHSSSKSGCTAASYRVLGSPRAVDRAVSPGSGTRTVSGISVALLDRGCKGSTVTLTYAVS